MLANGHLVDLGPNWIHGTDDNPILDLANSTDTPVGRLADNTGVYTSAGDLLPGDEGKTYSTTVWDVVQQAFEHSNDLGAETDVNKSLLDFFREKIPEITPGTDAEFERNREIVLDMAEKWGSFIGSPISRQSLKYFWLEECIEGGRTNNVAKPRFLLWNKALIAIIIITIIIR